MFAAPPKYSEEDLRKAENEATFTMKQFLTTSVLLYLSPFAVDAIWKLF